MGGRNILLGTSEGKVGVNANYLSYELAPWHALFLFAPTSPFLQK